MKEQPGTAGEAGQTTAGLEKQEAYYLNLMKEIRGAIDAGEYQAFMLRFQSERSRGV
jgi:hypothetical protein